MNTSGSSNKALGFLNDLLLPLKLIIPQTIIARIPGLTTNYEIRLSHVHKRVKGRLLDIGCGTNQLVQNYRASGGTGTGVDVYGWPGVDMVLENTAKLPFETASIDTVTFVACLNHIPNRDDVLLEARRVLKPSGRIVLTNLTPFISWIWHKWAFWDDDQHERGMEEGEVWGFSSAEMAALFSKAGFKVDEASSFSWGLNQLYVLSKVDGA